MVVFMTETNPFAALGWTEDEFNKGTEVIKTPSVPRKDPRICTCGHPARAHATEGLSEAAKMFRDSNVNFCRYGRMKCPCAGFVEIGKCEDVRAFTFRTSGADTQHALFKGVAKARERGVDFEWTHLEHTACAICGATEGKRYLVALDNGKQISRTPEPYNVFLCQTHYDAQGGGKVSR